MQLIGIGKSSQINYASAWTDNNDASVCADPSPFATWSDWGASQRDLFVIDMNGEVVLHQNITSGVPDNLEELILSLLNPTADPCELGTVYVSEGHNAGDPEDWIEIFNSGENECSLAGFKLDDSNEFQDFTFGDISISAGEYWLCYEDAEGCFGSGLGSGGDEIWLADPEGNTSMVTLLSSEESDGISLSQSFDANGVGCYTQPTPGQVNSECVTLSNDEVELLPSQIKLYQNYPNPFNPNTTIGYSITSDSFVDIKIFDMNGKLVRTLLSKEHSKGHHNINWDGTNNRGQLVSAGIYLYTLHSDKFIHTKKMILLK